VSGTSPARSRRPTWRRKPLPSLLFEIGCEELPARACREALAQLPGLVEEHLGAAPAAVWAGPRRLVVRVDDLPERTADEWLKGPPVALREKAAVGFAKRHGVEPGALEERDGFLGVTVTGREIREVLPDRLADVVRGIQFWKSMRWGPELRFSRPVRWTCAKLDGTTVPVALAGIPSGDTSYGHRFTHGAVEIESAQSYAEQIRAAGVEPDHDERRRQIETALAEHGDWRDPLGKLDEVVHLVERPFVLETSFDERYLRIPPRVIETAMQSHQRYFPLGGNRFAVVANGGDPETILPGYRQVLENRLDDAGFTFDRDVARGIDALAESLGSITFVRDGGSFADKTARLVDLVTRLGGGPDAVEAARLAKADQAAELVREFADLEGHIGAEYARRAGYDEAVAAAIDEQYLPDGADAPLPSTEAGRLLAAADKLDNLVTIFGLGKRPTGSSDPFALRRSAIGLCRLADEGGVTVSRELLDGADGVRDFVEERLEGLLDVPVEFVRAARASGMAHLGAVAALARALHTRRDALGPVHEVFIRAQRIAGDVDELPPDPDAFAEQAERDVWFALEQARPGIASARDGDFEDAISAASELAPVVARFFDEVLVMAEDDSVRLNRLRLLRAVRDDVGVLGDFSQLPL
jgi:glycyl-tRNA synthetase beta chain